jgi:hypothetical protein
VKGYTWHEQENQVQIHRPRRRRRDRHARRGGLLEQLVIELVQPAKLRKLRFHQRGQRRQHRQLEFKRVQVTGRVRGHGTQLGL